MSTSAELERTLTTTASLEGAWRSLRCGLALAFLFLSATVECAPRVVVSLTEAFQATFATPPPMPAWPAIIDPAALSELIELRVTGVLTGVGAADVHGHRTFFTAGTATGLAIEVIDTRLNVVEALINAAPIHPLGLVADPVRPRLYIAATEPQPQITVFDTGSLSLLPPILLPSGLTTLQAAPAVTQDGTRLFAVFGNMLLAVSLPDGTIISSTPLALAPSWLAVNASRGELYVAANIYGGSPALLVIATDSLNIVRSFPSGADLERVEVRPSDGALLVESLAEDDPNNTRLDAIDPITGTILATSTTTGRNVAVSVNGSELYRFRRAAIPPGMPYAETSSSLVILDALTLEEKGIVTLDTRSQGDPSRQGMAILGESAVSAPQVSSAVEYFDAALGHYFTTSIPAEIAALDVGTFPGWQRTGETLPIYAQRGDGPDGTTPVCRFYGLPEKGLDSHFYSASPAECAAVQQKWGDFWLLESSDVFDVYPADPTTGTCPFETTPTYRVYNNKPDANHRYTTSVSIRDSMVQAGWIPEGYGPNAVAFCVPR